MSSQPDVVDDPVFGHLEKDEGGDWSGRMSFPALAACQVRWRPNRNGRLVRLEPVSPQESGRPCLIVVHDRAENGPDDSQRAACRFLMGNQDQVAANLLTALVSYINRHYIVGSPFQRDAEQFGLASVNGVRELVELTFLNFLEPSKDDEAYVAVDCGSCFEEEHGISVLIHHGQVIATSVDNDFILRDKGNLEAHAQFCREIMD